MPRLKICPDCGGKMQKGRTKFITESDEVLIAIENLPADICIQCGAEYLSADVDEYIETVVDKVVAKKIKPHRELVYRAVVSA